MNKDLRILLIMLLLTAAGHPAFASDLNDKNFQLVAGAGPSTKIVQAFFDKLSSNPVVKGYSFTIPSFSTKHAGGIKCSNNYIFGRTGRPLNKNELTLEKSEIVLGRIPIVFATGLNTGITTLTLEQLRGIILGEITNWSKVGGADMDIFLIGREPTEAVFMELKKHDPFFKNASFNSTQNKDHHVVALLYAKGNAIGFGASSNFEGLNIVDIKDFHLGVSVGLVYDNSNKDHPLVLEAKKYAKSAEWIGVLKELGVFPPK